MTSFLVPFVVVIGLLWWVALPAALLIAIVAGWRRESDPLWVRRCPAYDPADPASHPCWIPAGEYCARHEGRRRDPGVAGSEALIA